MHASPLYVAALISFNLRLLTVRHLGAPLLPTALFLALAGPLSASAQAEGAAVFASVTTTTEERRMKSQIETDFDIKVSTSSVWVEGMNWTRLQSDVLPEADARALVAKAKERGYSAWYNSRGNQWATSAEQAPRSVDLLTQRKEKAVSKGRGYPKERAVDPATGDVSHLPMAETIPVD